MFIKKVVKISLIVNRKRTEREQKENRKRTEREQKENGIEELAGVMTQ